MILNSAREWFVSTLGGGATALAIIVAIIGMAGALGGAFSTYIVARRTLYVNTITAERMKWVTLLRTNIALLISYLTVIEVAKADRSKVNDDKLFDTFSSMNNIAKTIELQLNPGGVIDKNIIHIINRLYDSTGKGDSTSIKRLTSLLVLHSQWLLKDEWETVKYESRGWLGKANSMFKAWRRSRRYRQFASSAEGGLFLLSQV
ncbi:hypothetical protein ACXY7D_09375 [Sphingomonas melonis]